MKPEQERVRHLLTDTVTLLCKNGLQFQDELKVEGVIGITLDNNEVFVVHINEAFGQGGDPKPPPKCAGTGEIGATTLAELPGLVSGQQPRPRMQQSRGIRGSRGIIRGRPYGTTMRRGAFNSRRMPIGRQVVARGRGRSMPASQPPRVVPLSPENFPQQSPIKTNSLESPTNIVATETLLDDNPSYSPSMPNLVKQEPDSNGRSDCQNSAPQQNSFSNLSLGDITADNLPFFDPMNDNEDNSLEPPAKRLHSETEPNLASPLDSLMSVVSSNSSLTSPPQSSNTSSHHMPSSHSVLPQVKQEPSMSFPPSLQPMGGPADWQLNSPQKSPHATMGGGTPGNSADTGAPLSRRLQFRRKKGFSRKRGIKLLGSQREKCPLCKATFCILGRLNRHLATAHGVSSAVEQRFSCTICTAVFSSKSNMQRHMQNLHGVDLHGVTIAADMEKFPCDKCSSFFSEKMSLLRHMKSFHGITTNASVPTTPDGKFQCVKCDSSFSQRGNLHRHMQNIHGAPPSIKKKVSCKVCHSGFYSENNLQRHMTAIHGKSLMVKLPMLFSCEECDAAFSDKDNQVRHQETAHGKLTPEAFDDPIATVPEAVQGQIISSPEVKVKFACDECDNTYTDITSLQQHEKTVHRERAAPAIRDTFPCEVCDAVFPDGDGLQQHISTVHEESVTKEYYLCDTCNSVFCSKGNLTRHMKKHTGGEKYQCYICLKRFVQKDNYTSHMNAHRGRKPFKCPRCPTRFGSKSSFSMHKRKCTK